MRRVAVVGDPTPAPAVFGVVHSRLIGEPYFGRLHVSIRNSCDGVLASPRAVG